MKPEKAKFILYLDREKEEVLVVDPAFPTRGPRRSADQELGWRRRARPVCDRAYRRVGPLPPDRTVELGHVEDEFVLVRERGPDRPDDRGQAAASPRRRSQPVQTESKNRMGN